MNKQNLQSYNSQTFKFDENLSEKSDGRHGSQFEKIYGVEENNRTSSDLENYELKGKKAGSTARTTLFSKEPEWIEPFSMNKFIETFGKPSEDGQCRANIAINSKTINCHMLTLELIDDTLFLKHSEMQHIAKWDMKELLNRAEKKMPNMIMGNIACTKDQMTIEKTTVFQNFQREGFVSKIKDGDIIVEFRAKFKNTKKHIRNRGTCFRMYSRIISKIYERTI